MSLILKTRRDWLRIGFVVVILYLSWLALMAVHEFGHVLHAWLSGGRVAAVHLPLFDFSRTDLSFNPHPQFVAWGGAVWGCLIPLALYGIVKVLRTGLERYLCFFAGLCLVVNGAYIGLGWINGAGDAGTLLQHVASPLVMSLAGLAALVAGLWLWHLLGPLISQKTLKTDPK